jgi:hypothetical protein
MVESAFKGVVSFLEQVGVYDVVLPFLLVFTIVFAILEKTKVLGTEEIEGKRYTKKNLNAIMAFVIGFLVVASTNLVKIINQSMANVVLLLLLSVSFLLLIGSFFKEEEFPVFLEKGPWRTMFMVIMFAGIVIIFLNSFTVETDFIEAGSIVCNAGASWLMCGWTWLTMHWQTNFVATILLLVGIVVFMKFIVGGSEKPAAKKEEKSK